MSNILLVYISLYSITTSRITNIPKLFIVTYRSINVSILVLSASAAVVTVLHVLHGVLSYVSNLSNDLTSF